jgi:alpha-N-acetylglucosamine transferase
MRSIVLYGSLPSNIEFIVFTSPELYPLIESILSKSQVSFKIKLIGDIHTANDVMALKFRIFHEVECYGYDRILYLDTDVLCTKSLIPILEVQLDDKIYAVQEGELGGRWWCKDGFFDFERIDPNTPAMNAGIMLFKPNKTVQTLFDRVYADTKSMRVPTAFLDQSYLMYHAYLMQCYDNTLLVPYIHLGFHKDKQTIFHHFIGPYVGGGAEKRLVMMDVFHNQLGKTDKAKIN